MNNAASLGSLILPLNLSRQVQEGTPSAFDCGYFSMRLAFPVWENRISPVLDTATRFLIVDVDDHGEPSRLELLLDGNDISRKCRKIGSLGVNGVICGAVTRRFSEMLAERGIHVVPGVSGRPDEILDAWLEGRLIDPRFLMPGWSIDVLQERIRGLRLKTRAALRSEEAK
ncbi:MAG: hypothetical protein C4576_15020 [Desulfobacteraceae bacterium]|nr:MAG: hypothetical protein C4576_15020 [Desulfobacteraceae bacterium]